jgi:hypothetical protein
VNDFDEAAVPPSRREFAMALLAAPLGLQGEAQAQPAADPVADALFVIVQQRYGKFLTPGQLDAVRRSVARNQAVAGMLRQVKLANSDEPAFAFRADLS